MIEKHNKYKIISSIKREKVCALNKLSSKQIRAEYARITTEAIKKALWDHIYTIMQPKIQHFSERKQNEICTALCKHFEGEAFVIFKQNEAQIINEALSDT